METLHIWRISRHLRLWCTSVLAPRQNIIWLPILFALKLSMPCIYPPTCGLSGESIRLKYSRVWRTKKRLLAEIWAKGGNTRDRSENWERTDHTVVRSVLVNTLYAIIFDFCKHCIENTYGNIFFKHLKRVWVSRQTWHSIIYSFRNALSCSRPLALSILSTPPNT